MLSYSLLCKVEGRSRIRSGYSACEKAVDLAPVIVTHSLSARAYGDTRVMRVR